jgi:predicted acylesterase/phospholipase RssA
LLSWHRPSPCRHPHGANACRAAPFGAPACRTPRPAARTRRPRIRTATARRRHQPEPPAASAVAPYATGEGGAAMAKRERAGDADGIMARPGGDARPAPAPRRDGRLLVDLALQGGGAHGAFTWGVLDRLLEERAWRWTASPAPRRAR